MRLPILLLVAGLAAASPVQSPSSTESDGIVELQVRHLRKSGTLRAGIEKRATSTGSEEGSQQYVPGQTYGSYTIEFEAGTPGQLMEAILDTGSSDLWLNTPESSISPYFDPKKSSSYNKEGSDFSIQYGSGSAKGDWATDVLRMGGKTLRNQRVGVVGQRMAGEAVFGIGPIQNEASDHPYDNVPVSMKKQGLINRAAYSMYMDSLDSPYGRVVFGGIDKTKFVPPLYEIQSARNDAFFIDMDVLLVDGKNMTNKNITMLLDSGTTFMYLPQQVTDAISDEFGARIDAFSGLYFLENPISNKDFEFQFSGVKIKVSSDEMIVNSSYVVDNPKAPYVLGMIPTPLPPYILGDTFLRSVYVAHDLDSMKVGLAQAKYDGPPQLEVIPSSGIPELAKPPGKSYHY